MPNKDDPFAAYQTPLAASGDDPFAAYQTPLPYRAPDELGPGPGFIGREVEALQNKWRQANTPVFEDTNPTPGTISEQYMKERQKLQGWYGVGPEADKHNEFRDEHPVLAGLASVLASVEDRGADLLTPAFIATAGAGPLAKGLEEAIPGATGTIKAISPYAKWSTAGAYGIQGGHNVYEGAKTGNPSEMLGGATMMFPLLGEGAMGLGGKAVNPLRPKVVEIAGVKVPLLSGEADPMSFGATAQEGMKAGGIGAKKFMEFSAKQQEAVKKVISKIAQETGGLTSSISDEPADEVANAGNDLLTKARPMYQALDASMETVPEGFKNATSITKTAIARAKKLGVDIDVSSSTPYYTTGGAKFGPGTTLYESAQKAGLPPQGAGIGGAQPLTTFIKVKSELLKMARMSSDPALKYAIFNEVKAMDEGMERALAGTPLYANYKEAGHLWARGRALQEIAEDLRDATKGTPTSAQHPDLAKIPTEIQGSRLVAKLNDLYAEGTLTKAFTFSEYNNLRQAADILDRGSVRVGKFGVPIHGYGSHSTIYDAIKRLGMRPLLNAMTTTRGLDAIKDLEAATTKAGHERALNMLAAAATEESTPRTLPEVKKQAEQLQGNPTEAPTPAHVPPPGPASAIPLDNLKRIIAEAEKLRPSVVA